ncbi:MAG: flagellar basal body P-ring formation chaperone FlgA [Steroidobacteraceae bacterium]
MIIRLTLLVLLTTLSCVFASPRAFAQEVHSLENIREVAVHAVKARLSESRGKYFLSASTLDSRLRLARCASPLESLPPTGPTSGTRVTIGVRCTAGNPWTVYVPVTVEVELPVFVLQRALSRDARVADADVQLQTRRVPGSSANFVGDAALLQGRHLKRALPAGSLLTFDALTMDVLVRRGQQVTLLAQTGSMEIRAQGHALADGGIRDRIRVRNANSMKVVEGVVENSGTVRVEM